MKLGHAKVASQKMFLFQDRQDNGRRLL